jgi:hypothetical protein
VQVDFMKIDVEGFEPRVLRGSKELLCQRRIKVIQCEFNEHWLRRGGSSPEELEQILTDGGMVEDRPLRTGENRYFFLR